MSYQFVRELQCIEFFINYLAGIMYSGDLKRLVIMDEVKSFDMGVAGSLTMIFLSLAMVVLMVSFYRRYKRLVDRKDQE